MPKLAIDLILRVMVDVSIARAIAIVISVLDLGCPLGIDFSCLSGPVLNSEVILCRLHCVSRRGMDI